MKRRQEKFGAAAKPAITTTGAPEAEVITGLDLSAKRSSAGDGGDAQRKAGASAKRSAVGGDAGKIAKDTLTGIVVQVDNTKGAAFSAHCDVHCVVVSVCGASKPWCDVLFDCN